MPDVFVEKYQQHEERQASADDRNVREAKTADLAQIVSLHQCSFPGYLMTMLGSGFLRVYYETALESTGNVALIAEEGGRPVGCVVGYVAPQEFYAFLRSRRLSLALAAARGLLLAPELLPRILGNMRRLRILHTLVPAKRLGCATFTRLSPTFTEQRMHAQLWSPYARLISSRLPSYTVTKDTNP